MRPYGYKGHWDSDNPANFTRENEKRWTRREIDAAWGDLTDRTLLDDVREMARHVYRS